MSGKLYRELNPLLAELDSPARRVALSVCRAYKNPHENDVYADLRNEFDKKMRRSKRTARALRKLAAGLVELNSSIESSLQDDVSSWCDAIREARMPEDSAVLLPIYAQTPTRPCRRGDREPPLAQHLMFRLESSQRRAIRRTSAIPGG